MGRQVKMDARAKHTPGPWRYLEAGDEEGEYNVGRPLTICGGNNDDIANVYSLEDATVSISRDEAIANATLIAAAPDLLIALQNLLVIAGTQITDRQASVFEIARAAIAKARAA